MAFFEGMRRGCEQTLHSAPNVHLDLRLPRLTVPSWTGGDPPGQSHGPWTLGAWSRALTRATTSQPRLPMAIATFGRVVRPSRIDRTIPTTSHEDDKCHPHLFRG